MTAYGPKLEAYCVYAGTADWVCITNSDCTTESTYSQKIQEVMSRISNPVYPLDHTKQLIRIHIEVNTGEFTFPYNTWITVGNQTVDFYQP